MKDKLTIVLIVLFVIAGLASWLYAVRRFSNAVTPITVQEVEPGVRCATMVTGDGAAISCWQVQKSAGGAE